MKSIQTKTLLILAFALFSSLALVACSTGPETQDESMDSTQEEMSDRFEAQEAEREAAERAEAERMAAEAEAERAAAEAAAEAERMAAEAEAEAARQAAEAEAQAEAARIAAEEEAARMAAEAEAEAARMAAEAERRAEEEAGRLAAEREAAEAEAARVAAEAEAEAERLAVEQAEAERMAAEQAAEAERMAAEEAAQAAAAVAAAAPPAASAVPSDAGDFIIPRTPENIARLGNDLTPMGSIQAGNADGTIPPWTGGIGLDDWPAGYQPGDRHLNPYPDDEPLFVITGDNYQDYADRLSVGQMATFERYPDTYKMRVFPTRRSAAFPQFIYDATIRNAATGRLISEGEGVADVSEGFPFPLPQNSYELMWNHKLKYKGTGGVRYNNQVAPTPTGSYQLVRLREELLGLYYAEGSSIEDTNNILLYFFQEVESPARLAGNILLVHETLNQIETPRQAWIYNPGQRRVRRAPNIAYDNPGTASDGLRTNDMTDMFNGAMDRFTWEIVGKKEMYIPYNAYEIHSGELTPDDIVRPGHLNADLTRYELHRVWIVDARLREGTRHINSRRTFYLDEDTYQIALIDHYDQRGELWRASEAHTIQYYDVPTYWSSIESHMDLQSGRYVATGLDNQDPVNTFNVPLSISSYTPQALRTRGRR
jgi:hypothetical protein